MGDKQMLTVSRAFVYADSMTEPGGVRGSRGAAFCAPDPDPDRGRTAAATSSLGLLVRVGFVWGEEAGEATLAGWRGCWCMAATQASR